MSGRGNPALGEAGSTGGDLECSEGVTRVVGPTDLGGEHEADLLAGRAGPPPLVVLCGSKVAKQSLRGAGVGRSARLRRLRLGDQQPSLDMASVLRPAVSGVGGCGGCAFRHPGVRTRRARRTAEDRRDRAHSRWPRAASIAEGRCPPVSSRARHTQCPPGSDCVESHPRGLPDHRPSGSLIRSESQMTQRDRGRAWSHRLEDTPRPPAPRAANRMALVPTRCRSLEPMAGAARNPCHGRVPQRTGRLHHR
jgi:hypothetical protein